MKMQEKSTRISIMAQNPIKIKEIKIGLKIIAKIMMIFIILLDYPKLLKRERKLQNKTII
jgi:hypothetical protein